MLKQIVQIVTILGIFSQNAAEKRLVLHSDDDIASELMTIKAEMAILTQEMSDLKASQRAVQGAVYTRWGRTTCPDGADLVYHGYIAGKKYNEHGSGADNLCLPLKPTWGNYTDGFDGYKGSIYGTEIDAVDSDHVFPYAVNENDMPCAVCKSARSTSIMIPARIDCYPGWTLEYTGYLMTALDYSDRQPFDTLCMDSLPEFVPNGGTDDNEHILYLVEAHCGSLPCPPYVNGRELACAVCSM